MPKVTMYFSPTIENFSAFPLEEFGRQLQYLVAELLTTRDIELTDEDVDFLPIPYPPGSLYASPLSIEIETFGLIARKAKLNKSAAELLKATVIGFLEKLPGAPKIDPDYPLIWVKFQDPDGCHV